MFRLFEGQTADAAWLAAAAAFSKDEGVSIQASRNGTTREILPAAISIADPRQRWTGSRTPPMNIAFALAEVVWILAGRNDAAFLNYFNRGLPKFCGNGLTYQGAYGHRLRKQFGIDQLTRAYEVLKKNPESRQVVLQIWDSQVDLPTADGRPASGDVPCNVVAMVKIRGQALEWTQIMRSNDLFRGLPYNFVQFTTLQEVLAGWLGLDLGTYNHVSDSLHVYESELDQIKASVAIPIACNPDLFALSKPEFEAAFSELEAQANGVTDETVSVQALVRNVVKCKLPDAYRNVLCVLSSEGARRRKRVDRIAEIMSYCNNPTYVQLNSQWLARFESPAAEVLTKSFT